MILGKRRRGTIGQRPKPTLSPYLHKLRPRFVKFGTRRKFKCPYGTTTKVTTDPTGKLRCEKVCRPGPNVHYPAIPCSPGKKFNYDTDKCKCE